MNMNYCMFGKKNFDYLFEKHKNFVNYFDKLMQRLTPKYY